MHPALPVLTHSIHCCDEPWEFDLDFILAAKINYYEYTVL